MANVWIIFNLDEGSDESPEAWTEGSDESPEAWTVTLSVDEENEAIAWVARQGLSDPTNSGTMFVSFKEFQQLEQEVVCEEVRTLFEVEVIPILKDISNLDEVLDEQIPSVVQEIPQGSHEAIDS